VFAITIASFLINVLIIDGILSNIKSCQPEFQIWPYNCYQIRYNLQISASFFVVLIVFYLMFCHSFNFDGIFSKITQLIFLLFISLFFIFLVFSRHIYAPSSNLYHVTPFDNNQRLRSNISGHLTGSFQNLFRLKKRFLFSRLRNEFKENILTAAKDLKKRPDILDWELIRFTDAEKYELKLRYLKFTALTALLLGIFFLLLLLLLFN